MFTLGAPADDAELAERVATRLGSAQEMPSSRDTETTTAWGSQTYQRGATETTRGGQTCQGSTTQTTRTTTPTASAYDTAGAHGPACETKYYTAIEDRSVIKEHVMYVKEHHPVEKEFVVETHVTGREHAAGPTSEELIDTRERVVEASRPDPCEGHPRI
ncbi:hypothetical protein WJX72_006938 [[Myrmecia] bisecta]|uniref:Uncharacterized protein n=1 Tax=[Myrmecia] bisecta TaxID=41462 RepID=A0AAW1QRD8_9CHLO